MGAAAREPQVDAASPPRLGLCEAWRLSSSVALRPEPFGALAYHFGNRRLTFLKQPVMVRLVRGLADQPDIASALRTAGVPEVRWPVYLTALARLAQADMIERK